MEGEGRSNEGPLIAMGEGDQCKRRGREEEK